MAVGNECPVPTVNGIIGAGILAGLNNPQIIIKTIGMIFRIVMTDCILLENLVPIRLIPKRKSTSKIAIRLEYIALIPNKETN